MPLDDLFFDHLAPTEKRERKGPHWRQDGKLYFVTWRQGDSIPREKREEILAERAVWETRHGGVPWHSLPEGTRTEYQRLYHKRIQEYLDNGYGSCVLNLAEPRRITIEALKHFHVVRYTLGSFAIAGNHVHALVMPVPGIDLSEVQHTWKSFTAHAINKALGRTGPLWRTESYDRIVRNEDERMRIEDYILAHREQGGFVERMDV